jgi:hypothetical protein
MVCGCKQGRSTANHGCSAALGQPTAPRAAQGRTSTWARGCVRAALARQWVRGCMRAAFDSLVGGCVHAAFGSPVGAWVGGCGLRLASGSAAAAPWPRPRRWAAAAPSWSAAPVPPPPSASRGRGTRGRARTRWRGPGCGASPTLPGGQGQRGQVQRGGGEGEESEGGREGATRTHARTPTSTHTPTCSPNAPSCLALACPPLLHDCDEPVEPPLLLLLVESLGQLLELGQPRIRLILGLNGLFHPGFGQLPRGRRWAVCDEMHSSMTGALGRIRFRVRGFRVRG